MTYLADWLSVKEFGDQVTEIRWRYARLGPYADEFENLDLGKDFEIQETTNRFGDPKRVISFHGEPPPSSLSRNEERVLNKVLERTAISWDELTRLTESTWPIFTRSEGQELDLVERAEDWHKRGKRLLGLSRE
jgi:hypothetical protein